MKNSPSRADPGRREKTDLDFYFRTSSQRSVKIKITLVFSSRPGSRWEELTNNLVFETVVNCLVFNQFDAKALLGYLIKLPNSRESRMILLNIF